MRGAQRGRATQSFFRIVFGCVYRGPTNTQCPYDNEPKLQYYLQLFFAFPISSGIETSFTSVSMQFPLQEYFARTGSFRCFPYYLWRSGGSAMKLIPTNFIHGAANPKINKNKQMQRFTALHYTLNVSSQLVARSCWASTARDHAKRLIQPWTNARQEIVKYMINCCFIFPASCFANHFHEQGLIFFVLEELSVICSNS